jgi:hypothetical protein
MNRADYRPPPMLYLSLPVKTGKAAWLLQYDSRVKPSHGQDFPSVADDFAIVGVLSGVFPFDVALVLRNGLEAHQLMEDDPRLLTLLAVPHDVLKRLVTAGYGDDYMLKELRLK